MSQDNGRKDLKKYTKIRCLKKAKRPKMTQQQKQAARPKCKRLYDNFKNIDFIIDDESYFTFAHTSLPGNDRFYSSNTESAPESVRYKFKQKYEPKELMWIAISPKGMTDPVFRKSGQAVNQYVYLNKCIKAKLFPYERKELGLDTLV